MLIGLDVGLRAKEGLTVIILLGLLIVLLIFGVSFAAHFLFFVAGVLFVLWLIGFVIGRGENAGSHHFYRW